MRRAVLRCCLVTALALSVVGPGALVAAGDDGPSRPVPTGRPTRTILRPIEISEVAPVAVPRQSAKEVVLLVSGINSHPQDAVFDALAARFFDDPRFEVHRFGADPEHPYDALGALDDNARSLSDEIRELGRTHPAVHIVAHSMGGAVVDRALANGLSARDGVATYIALASPHSGSATLAATAPVLALAGDSSLEVRALFAAKLDVGSDAAHDLAHAKPAAPPANVTRLDLRMSTDWTVTDHDATDPGVDSRVLTPVDLEGLVDGHGAITHDARALDLVTTTIATRSAPPDTRGTDLKRAADRQSTGALAAAFLLCAVGIIAACGVVVALKVVPVVRMVTRDLSDARLRDVRRK